MKTTKIRLFVTMIILATVITTIPYFSNAQRRSSEKETKQSESQRSTNVRKSSDTKSATQSSTRSGRSSVTRSSSTSRSSSQSGRSAVSRSSSATESRRSGTSSGNSGRDVRHSSQPTRNNNTAIRSSSSSHSEHRSTSRSMTSNRDFYRINSADKRYLPSHNYRGSNKTWNAAYRSHDMNYNHSNKKYSQHNSFYAKKHWDRKWEHYRWNENSWRDYYRGYNPYSYRYSKYYFHHPHYGHVVRRFDVRPPVFYHNQSRYYCYDGHFFKYRPGVGYILVDLPYGFTFDFLPGGEYSERVYINGYLYFRVGNLFFEAVNHGYRLIHFPDRYYAYDDAFQRPGLHFNIDIF